MIHAGKWSYNTIVAIECQQPCNFVLSQNETEIFMKFTKPIKVCLIFMENILLKFVRKLLWPYLLIFNMQDLKLSKCYEIENVFGGKRDG
jgi:hypothetical protein